MLYHLKYIMVGCLITTPALSGCFNDLQSAGYGVKRLAPFSEGECRIADPVLLSSTPTTKFSSPVTLSCEFARDVGKWTADIGAKHISHVGGYNCRMTRKGWIRSQHSYGTAIDVSAINGVPISKEWYSAYKSACKVFNTVLTPKHDALHQHHLHIDNGWGHSCFFDIFRKKNFKLLSE